MNSKSECAVRLQRVKDANPPRIPSVRLNVTWTKACVILWCVDWTCVEVFSGRDSYSVSAAGGAVWFVKANWTLRLNYSDTQWPLGAIGRQSAQVSILWLSHRATFPVHHKVLINDQIKDATCDIRTSVKCYDTKYEDEQREEDLTVNLNV